MLDFSPSSRLSYRRLRTRARRSQSSLCGLCPTWVGRRPLSPSIQLPPPEVYSDPKVYTKVQEYTSALREIHGEDYNVRTEPIDAEAIMRLGGGKKHGRLWIADGAIDPSTV